MKELNLDELTTINGGNDTAYELGYQAGQVALIAATEVMITYIIFSEAIEGLF